MDANGLFVLSGLDAGANFAIASLEGDGGNVDLGTTNLTISGDAKTTYAGTFEGPGAFIRGDKSGNGLGSTTLTGDNSAYTSAVSVTGGSLYVNGQIGGAATVTGGTLGGSGTIGGDVSVAAGGNLAGRQGRFSPFRAIWHWMPEAPRPLPLVRRKRQQPRGCSMWRVM